MEGLQKASKAHKEARDFKMTHKEKDLKPIEILNVNSTNEFTEPTLKSTKEAAKPTSEQIIKNLFLKATYFRAQALKLLVQGKKNTKEYENFFTKLKDNQIEIEKILKKDSSKNTLSDIGSLEIGLESEFFVIKEMQETLTENEHICLSYVLDAEAKTDLLKVVLSEDKKTIEEVYFLQVKSNKDSSGNDVPIIEHHKRFLARVFENELESFSENKETMNIDLNDFYNSIFDTLFTKYQKGDSLKKMEIQDIFLQSRQSFGDNQNIINAKSFFSQAVAVKRDKYDKPESISYERAVEIYPSESIGLKKEILKHEKDIEKLKEKINSGKTYSGPDPQKKIDFDEQKLADKRKRLEEIEKEDRI